LDNSKNFEWFVNEVYKKELEIVAKPEIVFKKLEEE
jgi:hypothetical protein